MFFSEPRVELAQKLGAISPGGELKAVAFGVSGGEINDFALKLARAQTGREKIIAIEGGYHGSTAFAASASGAARFRDPFGPLVPDIVFADFGSIASLKRLIDNQTACVILEPVQVSLGIRIVPSGYLEKVRALCDQFGALMIVDENESALGRTGQMFAIDVLGAGVVPDILTLGNSLGGGLSPVSAALYRPEYLPFWEKFPFSHLSTFAGNDLGCVMGLETINLLERSDLFRDVQEQSRLFSKGFASLRKKYPKILKAFRGLGFMMAVDFVEDELGPQMSRDLSQFGVLASCSQSEPSTLFILPVLTLTNEDVESILEAFDRTLAGAQAIFSPIHYDSLEALIRS